MTSGHRFKITRRHTTKDQMQYYNCMHVTCYIHTHIHIQGYEASILLKIYGMFKITLFKYYCCNCGTNGSDYIATHCCFRVTLHKRLLDSNLRKLTMKLLKLLSIYSPRYTRHLGRDELAGSDEIKNLLNAYIQVWTQWTPNITVWVHSVEKSPLV